jgi:hypothetical protein
MPKDRYFCTITQPGDRRTTLVVESKAGNSTRAAKKAARIVSPETNGESVGAAAFSLTDQPCVPVERHMTDADWEAEGRRIALEGMDLPDGAYCAMAEELGLDPY